MKIISKNILFLLASVLCLPAYSQLVVNDTLGDFPFYYYGDMPQTGIFHDSIYCKVFKNGLQNGWNGEMLTRMYSEDTIRLVGITYVKRLYIDSLKLSLYLPEKGLDEPVYYVTKSFENDENDPWSDSSDITYLAIRGYDYSVNNDDIIFMENVFSTTPYYVQGEFYLGVTVYWGTAPTLVTLWGVGENHDPPYNFPEREWIEHAGDSLWIYHYRWIPIIFPIIEPECKAVEEVRVTTDSAGCLVAEWDSVPYQRQWVVAFSHQGTTTFDTVDSCRWRHCGLPAGTPYNISVRSRCTNLNSYTWSPWSGGADIPDPMGVATPEGVHFTVAPNPARDHVTLGLPPVSDSRVELYDATGRRWQSVALPPYAATARLDVAALPAGVYLLRLVTPHGVATRRLVVE